VARIDTLAAMAKRDRPGDVSRYWPRLREEAHELYREVGTLRGRVRQLERELVAAQDTADRLRAANERLTASVERTRARLRAIERSKGWRLIMKVRGTVRRRKPASSAGEVPDGTEENAPVAVPTPAPEPTFAQRRAAEAARRAEVAAELAAWIDDANRARGSIVVVLAGDRSAGTTASFIDAAKEAGDPVLLLDAEPRDRVGGIPTDINPTLVPDLLSMAVPGKERLLVVTVPGHAGVRWVVPAQQRGWWTAVVLDGSISPAAVYLASHSDVATVPDDAAARALEAATGVRPVIHAAPSARELLRGARAGWDALPRAVLGSD